MVVVAVTVVEGGVSDGSGGGDDGICRVSDIIMCKRGKMTGAALSRGDSDWRRKRKIRQSLSLRSYIFKWTAQMSYSQNWVILLTAYAYSERLESKGINWVVFVKIISKCCGVSREGLLINIPLIM